MLSGHGACDSADPVRRLRLRFRAGSGPFYAVLLVLLSLATPALARSNRLRPPPDVDLDPDRGMTFGRMSKITHDQKAFRSFNQATRPGVLDPAIDPYSPLSKNQYDPDTGLVHGSLNDAAKAMRQNEDTSRREETALARELAPQKNAITLKPVTPWPARPRSTSLIVKPRPPVRPH